MPSAHPLTDHDEIREWAEERGAKPACVRGTGGRGDTGMIRLDFPGFSGGRSLQAITWDEWFKSFDENALALLVQDETARGTRSNFNKLVARDTAAGQQRGRRAAGGRATRGGRKTARTSRRQAARAGGTARKSSGQTTRPAAGARKTSAGTSRSAKGKTGARKSAKGGAKGGRSRGSARTTSSASRREGSARSGATRGRGRS